MRKLFSLFLILLVLVAFVSFLNSNEPLTFSSLLEILSNAPEFNNYFSFIDLTIYSDWGFFNFIKDFINLFTSIIEFALFLVSSLINGIEFIFYFIQSLFGFSFSFVSAAGGGGGGAW